MNINTRFLLLPALILLVVIFGAADARAQYGVGVGLSFAGTNISKAGGDLADLIEKDTITYEDVSGEIGFYLSARMKYPMFGIFRLTGDISYVYFQAATLKLVDYNVEEDRLEEATFEVGTSMIPINAGLDVTIPIDFIRPYVGAQVGYTLFNRTYAKLNGDGFEDVESREAGEGEFGLSLNAGVELSVAVMTLDMGARVNLTNMFTKEDFEASRNYMQFGATLYFGTLIDEDEEE